MGYRVCLFMYYHQKILLTTFETVEQTAFDNIPEHPDPSVPSICLGILESDRSYCEK